MTTPEGSRALDRGLRILLDLAGRDEGATVAELASRLALSRPAVYRLLATLEAHAMVARSADGRSRLGLGVLPLAQAVRPVLRQASLPVLRGLAEETGATAFLTMAEGDQAVAAVVVEPSWTDVHVAYRVGSRHRLDQGAAGRAILAARAGERGGYVVSEGELQLGAGGVAAAVMDVPGVEASLGVVTLGRLGRPGGLIPDVVGPMVVAAAAAVASAIGGQGTVL